MLKKLINLYRKIWLFCLLLSLMLAAGACAAAASSKTIPAGETLLPPSNPAATVTLPPSETAPAKDNAGRTLHLLYWQAPTILNPHLSTGGKDIEASRLTYEPLASFDKAGRLVPFLAAEIPTLENGGLAADGKSVTWKLKRGVKWSDGRPFSADDVKFTYEFITNPENKATSEAVNFYADVDEVEIIDAHTVKIHFKEVNPFWAQPFVGFRGVILPRHAFADYPGASIKDAPTNLKPIGTGPYRVVEFATEDILIIGNDVVETVKIVYEANPYFREKGKPYFSRVELQGGGDAEVAARAVLEAGNVDYAWRVQIDAHLLSELEALGRGSVINNPGPFVERIFLNHSDPNRATEEGEFASLLFPHPFLNDVRVRRAFAYAINRQTIADLYGKTGRLTNNIMIARPAYNMAAKVPDDFDLQKARALLDEAGWIDTDGDGIRDKDGIKMKVLFQTTVNPLREEVQKVVKSALEAIGVEVELKITAGSIFGKPDPANTNSLYHFYADMQLLAWGSSSPNPASYLNFWTCQEIPQMANAWSGANFERWCNPQYDALYLKVATEIDPEKRRQLIIQMTTMLTDEVVTIPLIQRAFSSAVSNDLEGVDLTPWDSDVWNIQDWRRKSQ